MSLEIIRNILKRILPIIVILIVLGLIILGIWGIIILLDKIQEQRYNTFEENIKVVIQKVEEINDLGQNRLGINLYSTDAQEKYANEINEIKSLFDVDITQEQYYLLEQNHKQLMGIENLTSPYIVNYDNGIVFCLEPIKYKGQKYYTILDIQKRLLKNYSYDFPIIPEGFTHKIGKWDTGYVIQDKLGNEFVWVPVGMLNQQTPSQAFQKYYIQRKSDTDNTDEYLKILDSINKYGGFYIARFEASLQGATQNSSTGTTNILQIKQNVIPVSQVSFTTSDIELTDINRGYNSEGKSVESGERKGALELANSMAIDYKWNEQGIHTTLMYAEHYDTILYIVNSLNLLNNSKNGNKDPITEDSTLWGNYINSTFRYEKEGNMYTKSIEEGILLPTGAYFYKLNEDIAYEANKIFNIYDLAGNLSEWTMYKKTDKYAVRGGSYSSDGKLTNVGKYISQEPWYASANLGIRVVMYID